MFQMSTILLLLVLQSLLLALTNAWNYNGIDSRSTTEITQTQFTTLKDAGYIVYYGVYFDGAQVTSPDTIDGLQPGVNYPGDLSIKNARAAGLSPHIDAIHIPRYAVKKRLYYPLVGNKNNIYAQARKPIDYLNYAGGAIGRTWIYISEDIGSSWSSNQADNQAFLNEFLKYFPAPLGPQPGILTNQTHFQNIFGASYTLPADTNGNAIPLFWINCPNDATFVPFNGWTGPSVMRYVCQEGTGSNVAGSGVDANLVVAI